MSYKKALKKYFAVAMVFCMIMSSVSCAFTDLTASHWAYEDVEDMVEKQVLSGYNDGTFKPDNAMTRAEFATVLVKTLNIQYVQSAIEFKDVEGFHWAEPFIDLANPYLTGYVYNNTYYFRPDDPALREDAAVAIVKASGLQNSAVDMDILNKFSDKNLISKGLEEYVAIAVQNGLMKGNTNGTFNPKGNLTRAEVAALFSNIYEYEKVPIETPKLELPKFKLNEKDMTIDLGNEYYKYKFSLTNSRQSTWYNAIPKTRIIDLTTAMGDWSDYDRVVISDLNNKDNYVEIKVPKYTATLECSDGNVIRDQYIPLQRAYIDLDADVTFNEILETNINIDDIDIMTISNRDSLVFTMPWKDVNIKVDVKSKAGNLPSFELNEKNMTIDLGNEYHKYEFSLTNSRHNRWYDATRTERIIDLPTAIGTWDDYDRVVIKEKNNEDNYVEVKVPRYTATLEDSNGIIEEHEYIPLQKVRLYLDEEVALNEILETNLDKNDIKIKDSGSKTYLEFKMPREDVNIKVDVKSKAGNLPSFELNEKNMTIDLGNEYHKYEFSLTNSRHNRWYDATRTERIIDLPTAIGTWDDYDRVVIKEKNNEDNYVEVKIPRYTATLEDSNGIIEEHEYIPLQKVRLYLDEEVALNEILETNLDKNDIKIKDSGSRTYLEFKMPRDDVNIKVDVEQKEMSYNVKLLSDTGKHLTDHSNLVVKADGNCPLKYASLEIIYSKNSEWADDGKQIGNVIIEKLYNGEASFDFRKCLMGMDESILKNLNEDTMGLVVTLCNSKDFDEKLLATTFYGYSYEYKEEEPEVENEYELGDVNKDGQVNAIDATQILRYCNNKTNAITNLGTEDLADVNQDGKVNAMDSTLLLRMINNK